MANIKNIKDKDGIVYPVTKGDAVSMESGDTLQSELDKKLETVTTNDIQDGAVTSSKIGAGQVTSQNIDWTTSYGTGTLGSSTYITSGNARYTRWGNIVTLFMDEVSLPALSTSGSFPIFTGLPRAAESNVYFTIHSSAGGDQSYRCAMRTDGSINRHYASNAASTQKLTGQVTYICQS